MDLFPLTKDIRALLLRAEASLERVDGAVAEAQVLMRNANDAVSELRDFMNAFKAAASATSRLPNG